jgi:hypothetical protein
MKTKAKKWMMLMISILAINTGVFAQLSIGSPDYRTAIGLRGGELGGLTIKHFTSSSTAIEGILGLGYGNPYLFSATLLAERHIPALNISGMRWYYGAGGHITLVGAHSGYYRYPWGKYRYYYESGAVGLGLDGIFGLEYKIPPLPFAISLDFKPYVEVMTPGGMFWSLDPALGIKITF